MARKTTVVLEVQDNFSNPLNKFAEGTARAERETSNLSQAFQKSEKEISRLSDAQLRLADTLKNKIALSASEAQAATIRLAQAQQKLSQTSAPAEQAKLTLEVNKARVAFDNANARAEKYTQQLNNIGKGGAFDFFKGAAGQVAAGIGLSFGIAQVASTMLDAGKASLQLAMNMEQTKIGFTTLVGSAEGAQKHLDELRAFAAKTPFTFTDLTEASKKMMALGFETEKVIPTLTILGDAAAALNTGAVGIDRMSLALGQMQAKGRLSTQEMNQLTEAGVNGWKYIAKELGVTEAALRKMTEQGLVPADVAIKAILEGMQQDFGGLMAAQAETAGGKISNLTDALERLGTALGEQALPALGFFAGGLGESINNGVALQEALNKGIITLEEYTKVQNNLAQYTTTAAEVQTWLTFKTEEHRGSISLLMDDEKRLIGTTLELTTAQGENAGGLDNSKEVYGEALRGLRDFNLGEAQRLALEQAIKLASGELTKEDIARTEAIGFLTKQLELGNITQAEYIEKLNALATGAATARDAINSIPANRDINLNYRFNSNGQPPSAAAGDANLPGGDSGVYNPTPTQETTPGAGGAYAAGGTSWDTPVVVGEHGPEIWTPPSAGGSFANSTQSAGGATFGNIYVDARGSSTSAREIEMAVERALERAGQRADIRLRTQ